jgi:hypothetical protein
MRRTLISIGLVVVFVMMPTFAFGSVTPVPLIDGPEDQWQPFANDTWLAWTSNSLAHPNRWNAYIRPVTGGDKKRINAKGTAGFTGNFDPGTNVMIYEQGTSTDGSIYFYDADTGIRTKVPGVNSRRWEWQPKVSNSFILFLRDRRQSGTWYTDVLLFDRASSATRTLGTWRSSGNVIRTGNVGERYATFFVATKRGYFPFLYDTETDTRTRIDGSQPYEWAPVVDEANGTVYFAASGSNCGQNENVWRLPISLVGDATKIVDLPKGIDIGWVMSLAPDAVSGLDLLFYRIKCGRHQGDVYAAQQVDSVV